MAVLMPRFVVFVVCSTFFSWRYLDFAEEVAQGYFHVTRFGLNLSGDDALRLQLGVLLLAAGMLMFSLRGLQPIKSPQKAG